MSGLWINYKQTTKLIIYGLQADDKVMDKNPCEWTSFIIGSCLMLASMTSLSLFLDIACILFVIKLYMHMKVMLLHLPQICNVYMIGYAKWTMLTSGPKTWSTLIYTCYKCRSNVWYQTKWHTLKCCTCFAWILIKEICHVLWPICLDCKHVLSLWYIFNKLDLDLWYIIRSFYNQQLVVS